MSWLDCCFSSLLRWQKSYDMMNKYMSVYEDYQCKWPWIDKENCVIDKKGALHDIQFLPIRSRSPNRSKSEVFGSTEILVQAWVFLLMDDLLLLARWTRSSNKCGPIHHPQHITGELGWLFMPAGAWTDLSWVHGLKLWKGRLPHLSQQGWYILPVPVMFLVQLGL